MAKKKAKGQSIQVPVEAAEVVRTPGLTRDRVARPLCAVVYETPLGLRYYTGGEPAESVEHAKLFDNGSEARQVADKLDGAVYVL